MRLWSTVAIQLAKRPLVQWTGYVGVSALTAIGLLAAEALREVAGQRVHLPVVPLLADRGHLSAAVADDLRDGLGVRDRRAREARADQAFALRPVALGAGADELLLAEVRVPGFLRLSLLLEPRVELAGGDDL